MSKMRRSRSALVLLFVGIFALWWGIAVINQSGTSTASGSTGAPAPYDAYTGGPIIVKSSANNGVVSYSGVLALPSPCDMLGSGIAEHGVNPAHVTVALSIIASNGCTAAGAPAEAPFEVSISSGPRTQKPVLDGVTVNGVIEDVHLQQ
ncbi:MAG: hypothetical protein KGH79_03125 [Patescibacteria group bacterium]|nr:hypothetical protein [Patescibacteria group bacterium]